MHDALVAISELGMNRFAATGRSTHPAVRISIVAGCGDLAGGAEITFWLARFDVRRRSGASRVASDKEKRTAMIAMARPAVGELTQTTLAITAAAEQIACTSHQAGRSQIVSIATSRPLPRSWSAKSLAASRSASLQAGSGSSAASLELIPRGD
jgi:ribosomal protein S17